MGLGTRLFGFRCTRTDFLRFLHEPSSVDTNFSEFAQPFDLSPSSNEVIAVWSGEARLGAVNVSLAEAKGAWIPPLLVVARDSIREFLSWTWTYLREFRPLTAYTRVLEPETALRWIERTPSPLVSRASTKACLGLILGEALSYSSFSGDTDDVSVWQCASTLSFAITRGLALLPNDRESPSHTRRLWVDLRTVTKQPILDPSTESISDCWNAVFEAFPMLRVHHLERWGNATAATTSSLFAPSGAEASVVNAACQDIRDLGIVRERIWLTLLDESSFALGIAGLSRERRVENFMKAIPALLANQRMSQTLRDFVLGYLASQVGPGTMEHAELVRSQRKQFPTIMLWYGLCAGLHPTSRLEEFGAGLGRRILRDVTRSESTFESPTADISLPELDVALVGVNPQRPPEEIRTERKGALRVELLPGVWSAVRWPPTYSDVNPSHAQQTPTIAPNVVQAILETQSVLGELNEAYSRLTRSLNLDPRKPQKPSGKKKRPREDDDRYRYHRDRG